MLTAIPSDPMAYGVKFDKNNEPLQENIDRAVTKGAMIKLELSKYVDDLYVRLTTCWGGPGMRRECQSMTRNMAAGIAGDGPSPSASARNRWVAKAAAKREKMNLPNCTHYHMALSIKPESMPPLYKFYGGTIEVDCATTTVPFLLYRLLSVEQVCLATYEYHTSAVSQP